MNQKINSSIQAIKSFVRREGRVTSAQKKALTELLPIYGLTPTTSIDFDAVFGRKAPVVLEIGFGHGDALIALAEENPEINFLGVEVYRAGVGALLHKIEKKAVKNIRIINEDVVTILQNYIPDASLTRVYILFPDPWPKKKHNKRRLIQPSFMSLLAQKLVVNGYVNIATDWADYATVIQAVVQDFSCFIPCQEDEQPLRCTTKYERRGLRLGHSVCELQYKRI